MLWNQLTHQRRHLNLNFKRVKPAIQLNKEQYFSRNRNEKSIHVCCGALNASVTWQFVESNAVKVKMYIWRSNAFYTHAAMALYTDIVWSKVYGHWYVVTVVASCYCCCCCYWLGFGKCIYTDGTHGFDISQTILTFLPFLWHFLLVFFFFTTATTSACCCFVSGI